MSVSRYHDTNCGLILFHNVSVRFPHLISVSFVQPPVALVLMTMSQSAPCKMHDCLPKGRETRFFPHWPFKQQHFLHNFPLNYGTACFAHHQSIHTRIGFSGSNGCAAVWESNAKGHSLCVVCCLIRKTPETAPEPTGSYELIKSSDSHTTPVLVTAQV